MSKESTHRVHIYVTVRVPIDVKADDHKDAMEKALAFFDRDPAQCLAIRGEYADDVTAFLVDEKGDEEYEHSQAYDSEGNPYNGSSVRQENGKPILVANPIEDDGFVTVHPKVEPETLSLLFSGR